MRAVFIRAMAFTTLCVLLTAGSASAAASPFAEVPKGHWAYAVLSDFASLGLIDGYSEDAFEGEPAITRYEMAWVIARLGDKLEAAAAGNQVPQEPLSLKQREALARLREEFQSELALVSVAGAQGLSEAVAARGGAGAAGAGGPPGSLHLTGMFDSVQPSELSPAPAGSLKMEPNPGVVAAVSALPGGLGPGAVSGGRRLSELIGNTRGLPAGVGASGDQNKAALSIPLEGGAKAELSLGGPPMPGGIAAEEGDDVIARLDLKYALSQLAIFRAGYELVKDGAEGSSGGEGNAARATALLGIDYDFALSDSASIRAGYTYSRITELVPQGVAWSGPGTGESPGDGVGKSAGVFGDYTLPGLSLDARKTTASLGVSYTFGNTASVILGYRLIDFQELNPESLLPGLRRTNVATAELSIRF